jgi:hypothetical protein
MPGWFGKKEGQSAEDETKERNAFIEAIGVSLEAKLEEKLKPVREEVGAIKTKWEALEKAAGTSTTEEENNRRSEEENNLTDEQKRALNDRKMLALTIATNARITEGEILGEVSGKGLGEFIPKIKEYLQNTALERKGQADYATYCRNIVSMVVGEAALNQGLRLDAHNKKFFLEDAGGKGGDGNQYEFLSGENAWVDPRSGKVLSASDQLKKLGITPEEFQKSVEKGVV